MFIDEKNQFTDDNTVLGRYLGPALNVGMEMTSKITKDNGEVVHSSTYDALTESEA